MILKGQIVANQIIAKLKNLPAPYGRFLVVQLGCNAVSSLYVSKKKALGEELKVDSKILSLSDKISEEELLDKINELNKDKQIKAFLVQMPLPKGIDRLKVAKMIVDEKDVDGFHFLLGEEPTILPPTVLAIDALLDFYKIAKQNRKILIVGGGFLVGKPLARFWRNHNLDVEILEKSDPQYEQKLKSADIIVVATGGGRKFSHLDFKSGATVIDASTIAEEGKVKGDVEVKNWPEDKNLAPSPGGVGPVTVAMLYQNFYNLVR